MKALIIHTLSQNTTNLNAKREEINLRRESTFGAHENVANENVSQ